MRCVIWAAVSSVPQAAAAKDSLPSQIQAARNHIAQHEGWAEVSDPLIVPGHTRSYLFLADAAHDVPQYAELMELTRTGSIDLLICRSYDRLGRTDALVAQIQGYLAHHNVQVLALDLPQAVVEADQYSGNLDRASIWTSAIGRAKAQDEVIELRRRHAYGMRARIKSGRHAGNPPLGYVKTPEGLAIDPPAAEVVREAYRLFLSGMAPNAIVQRLRAGAAIPLRLSINGLRHVLRNPTYAGLVAYGRADGHHGIRPREQWIIAEGTHEPIIDRAQWEATQLEYARRSDSRRSPYTRYPLSGQVFCGFCGHPMKINAVTSDKGYRYYVCARPDCQRNTVDAQDLENAVAAWVWRSCGPDQLDALVAQFTEETRTDEAEQQRLLAASARIGDALERWAEDYEFALVGRAEYYTRKGKLEGDLAGIEQELADLENRRVDPQAIRDALNALLSLTDAEHADRWRDQANVTSVKAALRAAGVRITVRDGQVKIALDPFA